VPWTKAWASRTTKSTPTAPNLTSTILLRMDTATKVKTVTEGLKGLFTVNEGRKKFDLKKMKGGDTVYLQQQNFQPRGARQARRAGRSICFREDRARRQRLPRTRPANDNASEQDISAAKAIAAWKLKSLLVA
jgi:hypothetical protein